jgi:hypothetical protein
MAIEIFNRYENKYLLDSDIFVKLQSRISDWMELDAYNKQHELYSIANIYYDTPDSHLIRTSLGKPQYKEKLRVRSYGTPDSASKVYVEIKKKVAGLTNKRRSSMMLDEALGFLKTGQPPTLRPEMNAQVIQEVKYILDQHELLPSLYLAYDRRAYFGIGQHDLRLSFDTNIRSRRNGLDLTFGPYGEPLLPDGVWLMEVKTRQSIPIWLAKLLSEFEVYPISFSKYGTEYKCYLAGLNKLNSIPESVVLPNVLVPGKIAV